MQQTEKDCSIQINEQPLTVNIIIMHNYRPAREFSPGRAHISFQDKVILLDPGGLKRNRRVRAIDIQNIHDFYSITALSS